MHAAGIRRTSGSARKGSRTMSFSWPSMKAVLGTHGIARENADGLIALHRSRTPTLMVIPCHVWEFVTAQRPGAHSSGEESSTRVSIKS